MKILVDLAFAEKDLQIVTRINRPEKFTRRLPVFIFGKNFFIKEKKSVNLKKCCLEKKIGIF
jgi:hypothetical protein